MAIENDRDNSDDWLTILDAAFRLKMSWRIVSCYADANRIPCQERNGIRFVRVVDIRDYEDARGIHRPDAGSGGTGEL